MSRGRRPSAAKVGRKPDELARIGDKPEEASAKALEAPPTDAATGRVIAMPLSVAMLPEAEACWHVVMDGQERFRAEEVPLIEAYCVAYAAMRQALGNMTMAGDGTMAITNQTPSGTVRKSPDWQVWTEAVDKMRHLSSVLGLDTLTAERLNLTRAATASIALDLPARIREMAKEANLNG